MPDDTAQRHQPRLEALASAVLHGPGVVPPDTRLAAAQNDGAPDTFKAYVDTIHRHAYRVTDEMVAGLEEAGADDDTVFEISVASAFGAARERLDTGLQALRDARDGG